MDAQEEQEESSIIPLFQWSLGPGEGTTNDNTCSFVEPEPKIAALEKVAANDSILEPEAKIAATDTSVEVECDIELSIVLNMDPFDTRPSMVGIIELLCSKDGSVELIHIHSEDVCSIEVQPPDDMYYSFESFDQNNGGGEDDEVTRAIEDNEQEITRVRIPTLVRSMSMSTNNCTGLSELINISRAHSMMF